MLDKPPQKRRLETRAKLIAAATEIVTENGYDALRVEQVVDLAGVAKGTFFSHFEDKNALLAILIGEHMKSIWADVSKTNPKSSLEICQAVEPFLVFWGTERIVFDVAVNFSGIDPENSDNGIAEIFGAQIETAVKWLSAENGKNFRDDQDPVLLAEGVQAFVMQVVALHHCCAPDDRPWVERLHPYLSAWLDAR